MMISITKSQPEPKELADERAKPNGTYRVANVLDRLREDFYDKCYICESKNPTSVNVEHFIPHKGNKGLEFSWNNLFWSCAHCNNTKLAKYDNILNCTNPEDIIENRIKFMIEPVPFARVNIEALDQEEKTIQTVELLNKVYNGSTHLKVIEADYIREALVDEMLEFYKLLQSYAKSTNEQLKNIFFLQIIDKLDSSSAFSAFKRQLIKKHSNLMKIFGESFNAPSKKFNAS